MKPPAPTLINFPAIRAGLQAAELAYGASNLPALRDVLTGLQPLVQPLQDGDLMRQQLVRLCSGRSAVPRDDLDQAIGQIRGALENAEGQARTSPRTVRAPLPHAAAIQAPTPPPFQVTVAPGVEYRPREDQGYVARRAAEHYTEVNEYEGGPPKRGIFRMDTGLGKSVTYAFIIRELMKKMPKVFEDCVVIMGSHQYEPARDLADQVKAVLPEENVSLLSGEVEKQHLKNTRVVVGTYQQLAQQGTVDLLKEWAGSRRVLFVLDEADMVVFKGVPVDDEGEIDETGWHASWFRPLISFGLFDENGYYQKKTKHYMLGASATLDRPDGIPLSTVWGRGNNFYHTPMANGVRKGLLVPVVGEVREMDVPPDADPALFREFTRIEDGKIVVDKAKVDSAAGSDYAIKTAVRAMLDRIVMEVGVGQQKGLRVRQGIGYAADRPTLEKHMRWQQELFDLIETIFLTVNAFRSSPHVRPETVLNRIGGRGSIDRFGQELRRFLYWREWKRIETYYQRAATALKAGRIDGVAELFRLLYGILNVRAREIKGRRLVATAVWQDMEKDPKNRQIRRDNDRSRHAAYQLFPRERWPNRFGDREQTMWGIKDGEIDVLWSIGMLDRGFNAPMVSLIVDDAWTSSRREVVQRAGRITRPPNGRNPADHSLKPEAIYVTMTTNLDVHRLDLSRQDLARIYGTEVHPELRTVRIHPSTPLPVWQTPDSAQLELSDGRRVHLIRVGANTAKAIRDFLAEKYGPDFDLQVAAYDAGIGNSDELGRCLNTLKFPEEKFLKRWLTRWKADARTIAQIMGVYHSDLADMKTVYGGAWKIVADSKR